MAKKRKLKKKVKLLIQATTLIVLVLVFLFVGGEAYEYYSVDNQKLEPVSQEKEYYNITDFGYARLKSESDYNNNGKDDYKDIFEGELAYAKFNPKYYSDYYEGGYPPVEKEGVSSDLIWYSLKQAGFDLKTLVSKDISKNKKKYYGSVFDENIDFRRVSNLDVFFSRYLETLTTDHERVGEFLPGDIIIFDLDNDEFIGMISDKYTKDAVPYIISNRSTKQKQKEENLIEAENITITSHYRFENNEKIQKLINS